MNSIEIRTPGPVPALKAQGLAFVIPYVRKKSFRNKVEAIVEIIMSK